jgi:peptidoglycan/xylan/chitin deacetylase (PgdA/CDA1 family)
MCIPSAPAPRRANLACPCAGHTLLASVGSPDMVDLVVRHPPGLENERRYACDVVLRDWLGLDYGIAIEERSDVCITAAGDTRERAVHLPDVFFSKAAEAWLEPASMPAAPETWDAVHLAGDPTSAIPVLFGEVASTEDAYAPNGDQVRLPIDVFGSIFFLLTRYEEVVSKLRDRHDRFPGTGSSSHQFGFLDRPLANEYLEILWACLQRLWPGLQRRVRAYQADLSVDVDVPFATVGRSWTRFMVNVGADIVLRRQPGVAARRLRAKLARGTKAQRLDPNNTFEFIMAASERHGLKTCFFLKAGVSEPRFDERYSLEAPPVGPLLREMHARGHELGLHPSYHTYRDGDRLRAELATLLRAAERLGIHQAAWGGRQHYLRFAAPETWRLYASVGLAYDATLSYADQPGFRCGTCYDFPVYDLEQRRPLQLRERPLTVMELTLLDRAYLGLGLEEARERMLRFVSTCRRFKGRFSLLWHNNVLVTKAQRELYRSILDEAKP